MAFSHHRIGIYAGTFDPLHAGHLSFARAALDEAALSRIYFLPERQPRFKPAATPFSERVIALDISLSNDDNLEVLELPDDHFTVAATLPELQKRFPDSTLALLVGSDVVPHMLSWPEIKKLVDTCEFIIGMRASADASAIREILISLSIKSESTYIITTPHADVSSTAIKQANN